MLNCRIFIYTPVVPVARKGKVAPNATCIRKGVNPVRRYATLPACLGAIYFFNEGARHYMPIYSTGTIAQQEARQQNQMRQLRASNKPLKMEVGGLKGEVKTLKAEVQVVKTNQQAQPRLVRGPYRRRVPLPQHIDCGAGGDTLPHLIRCGPYRRRVPLPQPIECGPKRANVCRGVTASVSRAAAESAPEPPPENTTTTTGLEAILATLHIIIAGMEQMSAVRQGELSQLQAVLQPQATNVGASEQDLPRASALEVLIVLYSFFLLF